MSQTQATSAEGAKVIQLLDELVTKAIKARASDIHITPREARWEVRFRVDGVMVQRSPLPLLLGAQVASRIKVLARMDISDRLVPQDGVFTHLPEQGGPTTSLRCSTFPSLHGEKIVMRLLASRGVRTISKLGLDDTQAVNLRRFARVQGGLVVVTGPTGSGNYYSNVVFCVYEIGRVSDPHSTGGAQPTPTPPPHPALPFSTGRRPRQPRL